VKYRTTWPYTQRVLSYVVFSVVWVGVQRAETVTRMYYIINNLYTQC